MRDLYGKHNNSKIVFYAIALAVILGIGLIVVQDIQIPTEHVSQQISINLEK